MAEVAAVVDSLKRHLKAQKVTYAAVAKSLKISEASIKRMFSKGSFTLDRFDQICQIAGTSLGELAREADSGKVHISQLTHEQEKEITRDKKLLVVALCTLNQVTPDQIVEMFNISKAECIQLLVKLDRIKFLELLPNNQIKLRVTRTFSWLPDGPIQEYFKTRAQNEYFRSRFDGPNEILLLVNGDFQKSTAAAPPARLTMRCIRRTPCASRCSSASATSMVAIPARDGRGATARRYIVPRHPSEPGDHRPTSFRRRRPARSSPANGQAAPRCRRRRRCSTVRRSPRARMRARPGCRLRRRPQRHIRRNLRRRMTSRVAASSGRLLRRARGRQLEDLLARAQADLRRKREGAVPRALGRDQARVRPVARLPPQPRHPLRQGQEPVQDLGRGRDRGRGRRGLLRADLERGSLRGSGYYHLMPDQLERFRAAVADPKTGPKLEAAVAGLRKHVTSPASRRRCSGRRVAFPPDHPRVELLR